MLQEKFTAYAAVKELIVNINKIKYIKFTLSQSLDDKGLNFQVIL